MAVFLIVYLPTTGLLLWRVLRGSAVPLLQRRLHFRVLLPGNWRDTRWTVDSLTQALHHVRNLLLGGTSVDQQWLRAPVLRGRHRAGGGPAGVRCAETTAPRGVVHRDGHSGGEASWFVEFGYYRYAAALEMALPAAVIAAVLLHRLHTKVVVVLLATVTLLSALAGTVSFREIGPGGTAWFAIRHNRRFANLVGIHRVLMATGDPMGFLVPYPKVPRSSGSAETFHR